MSSHYLDSSSSGIVQIHLQIITNCLPLQVSEVTHRCIYNYVATCTYIVSTNLICSSYVRIVMCYALQLLQLINMLQLFRESSDRFQLCHVRWTSSRCGVGAN